MRVAAVLAASLALAIGSAGAAAAIPGDAARAHAARNPRRRGPLPPPDRAAVPISHSFIGRHQPRTIRRLLHQLRPVPMLAIKTGGIVTPLDIAQGRGDGFLVELNASLAGFGALVCVRPMPEMNGHWNEYSAFERSGASRGPQYSTAAFRHAFARIAIIARGGPAQVLNAKLRRLGQPGVPG